MHPLFNRPLTITWKVTTLAVSADDFLTPHCQKCETELDIHQPQEADPHELLGTCSKCGCWHLIQIAPDGSEVLLFNLPGIDFVRETLAQARNEAERERITGSDQPKPKAKPRRGRAKTGTNKTGINGQAGT